MNHILYPDATNVCKRNGSVLREASAPFCRSELIRVGSDPVTGSWVAAVTYGVMDARRRMVF